jgi:hypothetical protein
VDDRPFDALGLNSTRPVGAATAAPGVDDLWTVACEPAGTKPMEVPMTTGLADDVITTSFSDDLRTGFRLVAEVLAESELELLARARDSLNASKRERNQLLAGLVLAYRRGPRQLWAPVILDLLAPALIDCLQGYRAEPPCLDEEEIRQQLVLEVLRAVKGMPVHLGGRQMRIRIISRANKAVVRWLEHEGIHQSRQYELTESGDWRDL